MKHSTEWREKIGANPFPPECLFLCVKIDELASGWRCGQGQWSAESHMEGRVRMPHLGISHSPDCLGTLEKWGKCSHNTIHCKLSVM
eukprot:2562398-Amphidinium_carterae.1